MKGIRSFRPVGGIPGALKDQPSFHESGNACSRSTSQVCLKFMIWRINERPFLVLLDSHSVSIRRVTAEGLSHRLLARGQLPNLLQRDAACKYIRCNCVKLSTQPSWEIFAFQFPSTKKRRTIKTRLLIHTRSGTSYLISFGRSQASAEIFTDFSFSAA